MEWAEEEVHCESESELLVTLRAQIRSDDLEPAFKMLSRVARIQAQLIQSWDVLGTMTPADYMRFRDSLGQSSGFQSWQTLANQVGLYGIQCSS